jgi:hypothetical protein
MIHTSAGQTTNRKHPMKTILANLLANAPATAVDACEAMYSAQFRSASVARFDSLDSDDQNDIIVAAREVVAASMGITRPVYDGFNDWEMEQYFDDLEGVAVDIKPETEVVYLCNYKGEGEGWVLAEGNMHLPVFQSKNASRAHFGA